jgi:hypothetical protein
VPELFRAEGFVFFFYSNEGREPLHVHARRGGGFAKFWLEPLELDFASGMKRLKSLPGLRNSSGRTRS